MGRVPLAEQDSCRSSPNLTEWVLSAGVEASYTGLPYNYVVMSQDSHRFIRLFTIITLLSICHPTTCLHHIQPDNYIHINTSFRLFPPPVTSKASFLNLSNNGTTYPMTVSASTHLNILTELFSQCLIKTYVAITYQVDI